MFVLESENKYFDESGDAVKSRFRICNCFLKILLEHWESDSNSLVAKIAAFGYFWLFFNFRWVPEREGAEKSLLQATSRQST